jgi:hypothetical protein
MVDDCEEGKEMNYCKDCRHSHTVNQAPACYSLLGLSVLFDDVMACDVEGMVDPVDGRPLYRKCAYLRRVDAKCGPEGKLWRMKE